MITDIQFDALAALCNMQPGTGRCDGARNVMVRGMSIPEAAEARNTDRASLYASLKSINRALRLVHQAVTGQLAGEAKGENDAS